MISKAISAAALLVTISSCKSLPSSGLLEGKDGGRTGDGAGFENVQALADPPDYKELVKPFLQKIAAYEPTMTRIMQDFVEDPRTGFLKSDSNITHHGKQARSYIDYGLQSIVFFQFYWEASPRERLKVWLHELTHWVFNSISQRDNDADEERVVVLIENLLANVYDAFEAGDEAGARAQLRLLQQRYLGPLLPGLVAKADIDRDIGRIQKIPVFKDRSDISYPVLADLMEAGSNDALIPAYYEVNINRVWSREVMVVDRNRTEKPVFGTAALLDLAERGDDRADLRGKAVWGRGAGLLFPTPEGVKTISAPTNMGDPHYLRFLRRSTLSPDFLSYMELLKSRTGVEWIRTLYQQSVVDPGKAPRGDELPKLEGHNRMDFVIFIVD